MQSYVNSYASHATRPTETWKKNSLADFSKRVVFSGCKRRFKWGSSLCHVRHPLIAKFYRLEAAKGSRRFETCFWKEFLQCFYVRRLTLVGFLVIEGHEPCKGIIRDP